HLGVRQGGEVDADVQPLVVDLLVQHARIPAWRGLVSQVGAGDVVGADVGDELKVLHLLQADGAALVGVALGRGAVVRGEERQRRGLPDGVAGTGLGVRLGAGRGRVDGLGLVGLAIAVAYCQRASPLTFHYFTTRSSLQRAMYSPKAGYWSQYS